MAAAGILMVGFGIPINEFSLGNTLIISGTTAVVGGAVVIGLAVVARQVRALADAEAPMIRGPRSSDQGDPRGGPPRASGAPRGRGEGPRFAGEDDGLAAEAPASPAPPSRPVPPAPSFEPRDEPAPPPPRGPRGTAGAPRASEPAPRREPPRAPDSFDSAWPNSSRSDRPLFGSSPRLNGETTPGKSADRGPVTILKSGVVDGMAYTLYTDGSIEAELAQGVVRFGSIEELRNHLEKNA
ncbi:MAG: hypothetical protein AB7K35_03470 [Pseudorhodoplanes sp.]